VASAVDQLTLAKTILNVYATVIEDRNAIYVSAPVTSGRRLLEWHSRGEVDGAIGGSAHRDSVVVPNIQAARAIVREIRTRMADKVVIDPTALSDIEGWAQPEYRDLWGRVIEEYASSVIFVEGWEHSDGCCYEFAVADRRGISTYGADGSPLTTGRALELIGNAVKARETLGLSADFIRSILENLRNRSGVA
jgi:hypothetical protein